MANRRQTKIVITARHAAVLSLITVLSACDLALDSTAKLERARSAHESGDHRAAMIDAKSVLQSDPGNADARLLLGRALVPMGDGVSAEKELRRALDLGKSEQELIADLGAALLLQKDYASVLDEVSLDLAATDQDRFELMLIRGHALLGLGKPAEARELFETVLAHDAENNQALQAVYASYVAEQEYLQARETLAYIQRNSPDFVPGWIASGTLSMMEKNPQKSLQDYQKALSLATEQRSISGQSAALTGMVEVHIAQQDIDAAKEYLDQLMSLVPNSLGAQFLAARIEYLERNWPEAQESLRRIIRKAPTFLPAQMLAGALHLQLNNLGQAELYLSAVVEATPANADARRLLAETRLRQKKLSDATDILQPVVDRDDADAASLALAARASLGAGDSDAAIGYLERRIAGDPRDPDLRLDLAVAHLALGQTEGAQEILDEIEDLSGGGGYRHGLLGVVVSALDGDAAAALRLADGMLEQWPDDVRLHRLIGGLHFSEGRYKDARRSFEAAHKEGSNDIVSMTNLARVDFAEGDYASARNRFLSALEERPDNPEILLALARVAAAEQDREAALKWLERAREIDQDNISARKMLIRLRLNSDEPAEAEAVAREALATAKDSAELHNMLGWTLRAQGKHRDALATFRKASLLDNSVTEYTFNVARAHVNMGNLRQAEAVLDTLAYANPDYLDAALLMAAVKSELGQGPAAETLVQGLQRRFPERPEAHAMMAELLYKRQADVDAARHYDTALKKGGSRTMAIRAFGLRSEAELDDRSAPLRIYLETAPDDDEIRLLLAQDLQTDNAQPAAIQAYEEILAKSPDSFIAANNLAWAYFESGDPRATDMARRAYEIAPANPSVADTLGWILVNTNQVEEGIELLRKAAQVSNGSPEISYHLAHALAAANQRDEARQLLQDTLSDEENFASREQAEALLSELR